MGKGQGVQGTPILLFRFYSILLTSFRFYPTAALNSFHRYHQTFEHPKRALRGTFLVRRSPPPTTPPENTSRGYTFRRPLNRASISPFPKKPPPFGPFWPTSSLFALFWAKTVPAWAILVDFEPVCPVLGGVHATSSHSDVVELIRARNRRLRGNSPPFLVGAV